MKTPIDSVEHNLEVAVAGGCPVADVSALDPDALAKDHRRFLDAAVERVNAGFGPQAATAPSEVEPLYASADAIAQFFGPTGAGRDRQIDVDRAHAEYLARALGPRTFGTAPSSAPVPTPEWAPEVTRGPAAYGPDSVAIRGQK